MIYNYVNVVIGSFSELCYTVTWPLPLHLLKCTKNKVHDHDKCVQTILLLKLHKIVYASIKYEHEKDQFITFVKNTLIFIVYDEYDLLSMIMRGESILYFMQKYVTTQNKNSINTKLCINVLLYIDTSISKYN